MAGESGSLLIVDDNVVNRTMLSRLFEREGFGTLAAENGTQALEMAEKHRFDLVLLDVMMPDMDGHTVLGKLREKHAPTALPVIMVTAVDKSEEIVRALEMGANDYVTKPIDFAVVSARVKTHLSLRDAVTRVQGLEADLARRNEELEATNTRMHRDLEAAAQIQGALLPTGLPDPEGLHFAWKFMPSEVLAGDMLNFIRLDEDHIGMYVIDVMGHGVQAALLAVTLSHTLTPLPLPQSVLKQRKTDGVGYKLASPNAIADDLNVRFPWNETTEQYFTMAFALLNLKTRKFQYTLAGHPPPLYLPAKGGIELLEIGGRPIGLSEKPYPVGELVLQPGDRVILYSDGLTDVENAESKVFGMERFQKSLQSDRANSLDMCLARIVDRVEEFAGGVPIRDDVSLLGFDIV